MLLFMSPQASAKSGCLVLMYASSIATKLWTCKRITSRFMIRSLWMMNPEMNPEKWPDHLISDRKSFPQQRRDNLYYGVMKFGKAQQLLKTKKIDCPCRNFYKDKTLSGKRRMCSVSTNSFFFKVRESQKSAKGKAKPDLGTVVTAVLDDSLHLFMHELHAAQAGLL